jgi:hypothetical protein
MDVDPHQRTLRPQDVNVVDDEKGVKKGASQTIVGSLLSGATVWEGGLGGRLGG